jgi:endonuclease YncB( thermonuclease family)
MRRKGRLLLRFVAFAFAATAPFALHVDDVFAGPMQIATLASAPKSGPATNAALSGSARAIEGDLLEVAGRRVRLFGIDAPEIAQSCRIMIFAWGCGEDAQKMLNALIAERTVTCIEMTRDVVGMPAALCRTDGAQLNETMVRIGMALASPSEPRTFAAEEAAAAREGVGVWRSSFDKPWEWRAANVK